MAMDPKKRSIAMAILGRPSGPEGGDGDGPDAEGGPDELEDAMQQFGQALEAHDPAGMAAAFRAAMSAAG